MTFVLAAGVTVGVTAGVLGYLDNKETLKMLDYLKKEKKFKIVGEVTNPGGDIVFISQRTVGGKPVHDIPNGNVWTSGGDPVFEEEEAERLVWYVNPGAHINLKYDVSGEDFTKDGKTIRTACVVGPIKLTIMGTKKGKHINVEWVSTKSVLEVQKVLREELRRSLICYAAAAGLVSSLICFYFN